MGLTTSRSLGLNATYDWKRVKLRSNIQYVGTDRLEDSRTTVDNFLREDQSINLGTSHSRQQNHELVANASLEWKMDSVTTLIFRPQYRFAANDKVTFINFGWEGNAKARYIRYQASSGEFGGFLFTDEIVVK